MRNLYSQTKGQQAIRELTRAMADRTGNLPPMPGIFPDYPAPIVRIRRKAEGLPWRGGACRRRRSTWQAARQTPG